MAGRKEYLVPVGLFKFTRKFIPGHQKLREILWEMFNEMKVPFEDPCCNAANDSRPVRYNVGLQRLEYFDGATGSWTDITGITETTTTSTTTTTTAAPTTTTSTTTTTTVP